MRMPSDSQGRDDEAGDPAPAGPGDEPPVADGEGLPQPAST
jgi:hypothetical protein